MPKIQTKLQNLESFQNCLDLNLSMVSLVLIVLACGVACGDLESDECTTILAGDRIPNSNFFIPRYFWSFFFWA